MAYKEWSTNYPTSQDTPLTEQPELENDSVPGIGDGDLSRVSQIHAMRDKLDAVAKKVGDNSNLPSGCLLERVTNLETSAVEDFTDLGDAPSSYTGQAGKGVRVKGTEDGLEFTTFVGSDEKTKISGTDTTTGYLNDKVAVANGLTKTILLPSGNEQLQLSPTYGSSANTVCQGNDSRLSDARTPTTHASSHQHGGGDQVGTATPGANAIPKADGSGKLDSWVTANAVAGTPSLRQLGTGSTDACAGNDARLSDARTPTTHASSHQHGGGDQVGTATPGANAIPKADGSGKLDSWVTANAAGGTASLRQLGTGSTDACAGNDSRLSDARTPTPHASTHKAGGTTDEIKLDDLAAPDDNTDLNATTGQHGLLMKLGGGTTNFLRADGSWAAPPGGTDTNAIHKNTAAEINGLTAKGTPVGADELVIEDSADSWNKKKVAISTLPAGVDTTAIHKATASEIHGITSKASPVGADELVIEDSADSWNKKRVTISTLPTGSGDSDAIHKSVAAEISTLTAKGTPVSGDLLIIEDSADSNNKKKITIGTLPGDAVNAIHTNVAGEINGLTSKGTPVSADLLVIEDSADSNNKKKITIGTLPGGSGPGGGDIATILHQNTENSSNVVVGAFTFDKTDFSTATTIKFKATGYVSDGSLTGTLEMYNLTDASTVVSLTFTSVTIGEQISADVKASLPSSHKVYEFRLKVTDGGGPGSGDLVMIEWAGIEIR